jgi:predicted ATPase
MRLKTLHLRGWKNLRDFRIEFGDSLTNVLVGPNGTGKSNVLEALVVIFRDLDLNERPAFAYDIVYECRGAEIVINTEPTRKDFALITVNGESISRAKFSRREGDGQYLPGYVFGYYSGPSNRMEQYFEKHQRLFSEALLDNTDQPLRHFMYARLVYSQFVLLSFIKGNMQEKDLLKRFLRIRNLDSVLFILKRPEWASESRLRPGKDPGDKRFWYARGVVGKFLGKLYDHAFAPLRITRKKTSDRRYLFLDDVAAIKALSDDFANAEAFFTALESLSVSELVEDVRVRVLIEGVDSALTFRELSEGEQQLLMVLGLLNFIEGEEGLILLDEPDTHLNPYWSLQYAGLLRQNVRDPKRTQIVMATHDPLVVAGLTREEVHIMRRGPKATVTAYHPEEDPKGMGIAALLTSDVYGLRAALDEDTMEALDRKRVLMVKKDLNEAEETELAELAQKLGELDFSTSSVRDPLYAPFVSAMTNVERELGWLKPVLSAREWKDRENLAHKIVSRMIAAFKKDGYGI